MSPEPPQELVSLASEAYVHGYPLVLDLSMVETAVHRGFGALAPAPFNHFAHADRSAGPDARFASVDNDTVYSNAQLDLSKGPLRLHVPDTGGAYRVIQFADAWTDDSAYVGSRATGTSAGDWLVVPPAGRVRRPTTCAG